MGNLGLFAERGQERLVSFQLEGGKLNKKHSLQANSEKLQTAADDVVSPSIISKLIWCPAVKIKTESC